MVIQPEVVASITQLPNLIKGIYDLDVKFEYDANGNLTKMTITVKDRGGITKTIIITMEYDANGNLIKLSKKVQ